MKKRLSSLVMLGLICSTLTFGTTTPAHAVDCATHTSTEKTFRFASIPAKMASDESYIELRMGIKNTTGLNAYYKVDFFVDTFDAYNLIGTTSVGWIANGTWGLHRLYWDPPAGYAGIRWLQNRVWRQNPSTQVWEMVSWSSDGGSQIRIVDTMATLTSPSYLASVFAEPLRLSWDMSIFNSATLGPQYVTDRVNEMATLGITTLIVAYPEMVSAGAGPFYPADPSLGLYPPGVTTIPDSNPSNTSPNFDVIGAILHAACIQDMRVLIGLGRGAAPWLDLDNNPTVTAMNNEADREKLVAQDLYNKYGKDDYYGKAFYGWYNTYEANDFTPGHAMTFYNRAADNMRGMGPEKPVMLAPAGTPIGMTSTLASATSDIFAFGDAVAMGYIDSRATCQPNNCGGFTPPAYTGNPQLRIVDLDNIFQEYENYLGAWPTKHIWSNTEVWRKNNPNDPPQWVGTCAEMKSQTETERWHVEQMMTNEMFSSFKGGTNTSTIPATGATQWYYDYSMFWTRGGPGYSGSPALCAP
jgi:hypothetical protein